MKELQKKIQKVIEARTGTPEGYEAILAQLSEYQDLVAEKRRIDTVLDAMKGQQPHYAELLRLRYIKGLPAIEVAEELGIVRRTFDRWRQRAIDKYSKLSGIS
ncbi:helix-turn-helix domain-containing protein [Paenibacillus melissococcoides]|uniref:Helix-turn-helix domain-containing protein n=1 Tax=Paenibacillus melissococcoides TaxID=2912268 RepID=A0ABM9G6W3_9BACL|nr:helix-turn-helix domain-containing protein [Paenibacillus melissococcoides]GIO83051.1 hypothetical protein J6TS7_66610 [Paenibacillus dendritiformis]CAH8247470.1 helix-turn-helix domain-containing protein [Paenibacillus melissococcoides]CAH8705082.1 helix-turn-helix domain-containing protein [Paenibacillus melissococcoides]CAH8707859.1 helix-turn-helix domain-containing protein [Paenibacillus melissococcoides]CAH8714494.1 helix-turn-helix domain-containing protein [Paenibacillus melissococc